MAKDIPTQSRVKQEAKALKKQQPNLKHTQALDQVVKNHGFKNYDDYNASLKSSTSRPTFGIGTPISDDSQLELFIDDKLTKQSVVFDDFREAAAKKGVDFAILIPTQTGLKKSILDATGQIRNLFEKSNFHTYSKQNKGPEFKVIKDAVYVTDQGLEPTKVSLYRPVTKDGDPRMWFSRLKEFAQADDQIAIVFFNDLPHLINITVLLDLKIITKIFEDIASKGEEPAIALVNILRDIAKKGPIKSTTNGDTAVGMAVEMALGIGPNSAKGPDYLNCIELKAARENKFGKARQTRQTLFAQVADWGHPLSRYKSSAAILDKFGYQRDSDFKLYCTIAANKFNSQGLSFVVSDDDELLYEIHQSEGVVAVWPAKLLTNRLIQKHSETFWIKAQSNKDEFGNELFTLKSIVHTKRPLENQLMRLIRDGYVTMDHLIKRTEDGQVKEKGPLFKISAEGFKYLFPDPVEYLLTE
jgi:hypothetical protein